MPVTLGTIINDNQLLYIDFAQTYDLHVPYMTTPARDGQKNADIENLSTLRAYNTTIRRLYI